MNDRDRKKKFKKGNQLSLSLLSLSLKYKCMFLVTYLMSWPPPFISYFNFEFNLPQEAAFRGKCFMLEQIALIDNFFLKFSLPEVLFFPFVFHTEVISEIARIIKISVIYLWKRVFFEPYADFLSR